LQQKTGGGVGGGSRQLQPPKLEAVSGRSLVSKHAHAHPPCFFSAAPPGDSVHSSDESDGEYPSAARGRKKTKSARIATPSGAGPTPHITISLVLSPPSLLHVSARSRSCRASPDTGFGGTTRRSIVMGCVQAKGPSMDSPLGESRLDVMKRENDYFPVRRDDEKQQPLTIRLPPGRRAHGTVVMGEEESEGNAVVPEKTLLPPSQLVKPVVGNADELVDGWPRWLVNNVPPEMLAGLIPKSRPGDI
ncbi:hypothetical protein GW17_00030997, partial [Ensete ventricosum]